MGYNLKKAIFFMVLSTLSFAMMGAAVKFSSQEVPFFETVFFRNFFGFIFLLIYFRVRGIRIEGHNKKLLLLRSLSGFIALVLFFLALAKLQLVKAVILNFSSPIFVAIFSILLLKERFHPAVFVFVLLGFIGAWLMVSPETAVNLITGARSSDALVGNPADSIDGVNIVSLLGLVSAVFAALAYICVRKLSATDSVETIVFYFTGISTLLALPTLLLDFALPDANGWLGLAGVGLFATLGQLFLTSAYKYERASIVSSFSYMTPLFSFFLGILFFGEIPAIASIIGSLLIILSGISIAILTRTPI